MLKFTNIRECPSGGFRMFVKETQTWIHGIDWDQYLQKLKDHYRANDLPIGLLFNAQAEHEACSNSDPSFSYDEDGVKQAARYGPTTYQQFKSATGTLLQWFLTGKRKTPDEEIERRSKICLTCPLNQKPTECPTCQSGAIRTLIDQFVGGKETEWDARLQACRICGCSLKAKIRIPLNIIRDNEPDVAKGAYPEYCWLA